MQQQQFSDDDGEFDTKMFVEAFRLYDKDKSGALTKGELQRMIDDARIYGPKPRVENIMTLKDSDGDGEITLEEFLTVGGVECSPKLEVLQYTFRCADKNRDGKISPDELIRFLEDGRSCKLNEKERASAKKICKRMDLDGNGALDASEFFRVLKNEL